MVFIQPQGSRWQTMELKQWWDGGGEAKESKCRVCWLEFYNIMSHESAKFKFFWRTSGNQIIWSCWLIYKYRENFHICIIIYNLLSFKHPPPLQTKKNVCLVTKCCQHEGIEPHRKHMISHESCHLKDADIFVQDICFHKEWHYTCINVEYDTVIIPWSFSRQE